VTEPVGVGDAQKSSHDVVQDGNDTKGKHNSFAAASCTRNFAFACCRFCDMCLTLSFPLASYFFISWCFTFVHFNWRLLLCQVLVAISIAWCYPCVL